MSITHKPNRKAALCLLIAVVGLAAEKPAVLMVAIIIGLLELGPRTTAMRLRFFCTEIITLLYLLCLQYALQGSLLNALQISLHLIALLLGAMLIGPWNKWYWYSITGGILVTIYANPFLYPMSTIGAERQVEEFYHDIRNYWGAVFTIFVLFWDSIGKLERLALLGLGLVVGMPSGNKFSVLASVALFTRVPILSVVVAALAAFVGIFVLASESVTQSAESRLLLYSTFFEEFRLSENWVVLGDPRAIIELNSEGVRSFHSFPLDIAWLGGVVGIALVLFMFIRSVFALHYDNWHWVLLVWVFGCFGLPPLGNERQFLIAYAAVVASSRVRKELRAKPDRVSNCIITGEWPSFQKSASYASAVRWHDGNAR